MQWKFSGGKPVYLQIMEQLRGAILAGEFQPGDRIPPVREFAAQAQVNPNTMQRALLELEREGLLITDGTVGRYVTRDTGILKAMGREAADTVIRSAAAQFRAMGISLQEAARLLLAMEEEEA